MRGQLNFQTTGSCWRELERLLQGKPIHALEVDASEVELTGGIGAALLRYLVEAGMTRSGPSGSDAKHLDETDISGLSANANKLVTDLRGISASLQTFVGQTNEWARAANPPTISADATKALVQLNDAVGKLDRIATGFNESSLNESLENARRATLELQQAIHKFREYRAGTLFGKPPPPARSIELPRG